MTSEEIVREIDEASLTILRLTSEVVRLREELAEARKECEEQARLNGMGAERELALRAEVVRLRSDLR